MKKIIRLTFLFLISALPLAACGSLSTQPPTPTVPPLVTLNASGSGTITTVLQAITPAFEAATPGYKLVVLSGNSTGSGVTGILEGVLDVAAMARAPKDEETAKNIKYYEMGLVGQAFIVHSTMTGITDLSTQQVIDIFSGKIINWSEISGPNLKIVVYVRDEDDSSTKGFRKAIFGETPFADTSETLKSQEDMIISVQGTPGSIGIAAWPAVLATKAKVHALAIDAAKPSDASYPILGSAGIGYMAEREGDIQPLINWLSSTSGQSELKLLGFVANK
jgi:phosphate transport system substrate-binding protein